MERAIEHRRLAPALIFSLEDVYARDLLGPHSHPRPYEPLRFWLVARTAPGAPAPYLPPRELVVKRNSAGYHLFFGGERVPAGGRHQWGSSGEEITRRIDLAPGTYLVRVTSPLYQTEERQVVVPMPNLNLSDPFNPDPALREPLAQYTFELRPSYAYPFAGSPAARLDGAGGCGDAQTQAGRGPTLLYGGLYTSAGAGLDGALVEVVAVTRPCRTDERGQWVLWFPDSQPTGPVTVRVTPPSGAAVDIPDVCVVRGRSASLAQARLRGRVLHRGAGVAGASVVVSGQPGAAATRADGEWVYAFGLGQPDAVVTVTATLPGGASRTLSGIGVRSRATVVVPSFVFP